VGSVTAVVVVILILLRGRRSGCRPVFARAHDRLCAAAALVGLVNGVLNRGVGLSPWSRTLSTFIALQGVALLMRSTPDGYYRSDVMARSRRASVPCRSRSWSC
jgi:ribose/xylose/arabinose/galactoside ABC-type transport system permease subunit